MTEDRNTIAARCGSLLADWTANPLVHRNGVLVERFYIGSDDGKPGMRFLFSYGDVSVAVDYNLKSSAIEDIRPADHSRLQSCYAALGGERVNVPDSTYRPLTRLLSYASCVPAFNNRSLADFLLQDAIEAEVPEGRRTAPVVETYVSELVSLFGNGISPANPMAPANFAVRLVSSGFTPELVDDLRNEFRVRVGGESPEQVRTFLDKWVPFHVLELGEVYGRMQINHAEPDGFRRIAPGIYASMTLDGPCGRSESLVGREGEYLHKGSIRMGRNGSSLVDNGGVLSADITDEAKRRTAGRIEVDIHAGTVSLDGVKVYDREEGRTDTCISPDRLNSRTVSDESAWFLLQDGRVERCVERSADEMWPGREVTRLTDIEALQRRVTNLSFVYGRVDRDDSGHLSASCPCIGRNPLGADEVCIFFADQDYGSRFIYELPEGTPAGPQDVSTLARDEVRRMHSIVTENFSRYRSRRAVPNESYTFGQTEVREKTRDVRQETPPKSRRKGRGI